MSTRRGVRMLRRDPLAIFALLIRRSLEPRGHSRLLHTALLGGGLSGLWLADRVASSETDHSEWWVVPLVAVVAGSAISALGVALFLIITESQSRAHRIFCSKQAFVSTAFSVVLGSALALPALRRDPFHHILSTGRITGATIVDFVMILAVAACVIGAIGGAFGTMDAIREERTWAASLGRADPYSAPPRG